MKTATAILSIESLTAGAIPELSRTLESLPGVRSIDFSLERSVAVVEFDPTQINVEQLMRAVLKAGFKVI